LLASCTHSGRTEFILCQQGISQTLIIARIGFVRLALTPEAQLAIADFATRMDDGAVDVEDDISWMSASNSKL
jgi:hypothetical protein